MKKRTLSLFLVFALLCPLLALGVSADDVTVYITDTGTKYHCYGDGSFRPNEVCSRWAVVLFMYRDLAN